MTLADINIQNYTIMINYKFGTKIPLDIHINEHLQAITRLIDVLIDRYKIEKKKYTIIYDCSTIPVRLNLIYRKVAHLRKLQNKIDTCVDKCYIKVPLIPNYLTSLVHYLAKYSNVDVTILHA